MRHEGGCPGLPKGLGSAAQVGVYSGAGGSPRAERGAQWALSLVPERELASPGASGVPSVTRGMSASVGSGAFPGPPLAAFRAGLDCPPVRPASVLAGRKDKAEAGSNPEQGPMWGTCQPAGEGRGGPRALRLCCCPPQPQPQRSRRKPRVPFLGCCFSEQKAAPPASLVGGRPAEFPVSLTLCPARGGFPQQGYHRGRRRAGRAPRTAAPVTSICWVSSRGQQGLELLWGPPVPGTPLEGSRCCPQWLGLHAPSLALLLRCPLWCSPGAPDQQLTACRRAGPVRQDGRCIGVLAGQQCPVVAVEELAGSRLWRARGPLLAGYFPHQPGGQSTLLCRPPAGCPVRRGGCIFTQHPGDS